MAGHKYGLELFRGYLNLVGQTRSLGLLLALDERSKSRAWLPLATVIFQGAPDLALAA